MKKLLLIDAHALIHRSFHALPPLTSPDGKPVGALYGLASTLIKTLAADKPDFVAAAFDRPEPTLRKQEFKDYKAHRPPAPDELISQLVAARGLFETFGISCFEKAGYEGDDLVGTLAKKFVSGDLLVEILTGDLDTLQLVEDTRLVVRTMKKGVSDTFVYDETAVKERYGLLPSQLPDYKGLVGDTSDNIPGVRGVGPKTATELLRKFVTLEKIFSSADPTRLAEATTKREERLASRVLPYEKEALFSRKLATIDTNVPLPEIPLESLAFSGIRSEKIAPYFESLGFSSLLRRIGVQKTTARPVRLSASGGKPELPLSLFATQENSTTDDPGAPFDPHTVIVMGAEDALHHENTLGSDAVKIAPAWKPILREFRDKNTVVRGPLFDISVAGWLLDPDGNDFSPGALGVKYLRAGTDIGPRELLRKLADVLGHELRNAGLLNIFESIEMPLIPVLADMERAGIAIDETHLSSLLKDLDREIARETDEIYRGVGTAFNLNSPRQVGEMVFERLKLVAPKMRKTSTGQRRMNRDVLESLKGSHPVIEHILEYREDFKVRSSFVAPLVELMEMDGRIHTTFLQTGTGTGRLSSEKPNLQNIPQESRWSRRLRDAFVAEPKWSLLSLDYSQLELRLLAHATGDEALARAFRAGKDIHTLTASQVLHVAESEVTKEMRRLAKTLNFGVVYGMGARAFSETSGIPRADAERFISDYFAAFPTIKRWQEEVKTKARERGYVENANGRRRWFPQRSGYASGEFDRAAINMPLQSLGADIIKLAMIRTSGELSARAWNGTGVRLVLSIHDELLFEVRDDILKEVVPVLRSIMERVVALSVPLRVDAASGKTWGSCTPFA